MIEQEKGDEESLFIQKEGTLGCSNIAVDDLVTIVDDTLERSLWKMGRTSAIYEDGLHVGKAEIRRGRPDYFAGSLRDGRTKMVGCI